VLALVDEILEDRLTVLVTIPLFESAGQFPHPSCRRSSATPGRGSVGSQGTRHYQRTGAGPGDRPPQAQERGEEDSRSSTPSLVSTLRATGLVDGGLFESLGDLF
jgi:hypothetical protein